MSYVDLHLHLLPGVDDGAGDEQQSIAFARRMVEAGVREATVTPHVGAGLAFDPLSIPARVSSLSQALRREGLDLRLHAGGEVYPDGARSLSEAELEVISHGPPGSRWLLLEVPFGGIDARFVGTCRALRERGYAALIAHPERAANLLPAGLRALRPEIEAGALLQVNVCSLLGVHGETVRGAALALVRSGLAFVIASDAHPGTREQTLASGFELALAAGVSPLQAHRLTAANPAFLLEHGIPPTPGWLDTPGPSLLDTVTVGRPERRRSQP
jgi:protein-tyrosine phosphatase